MEELNLTLSQVPVSVARICLRIAKHMREDLSIQPNTTLLLALSGGADSNALACILKILQSVLCTKLFAITCNHRLRTEAEEEIASVLSLCAKLAIPCKSISFDTHNFARCKKIGIEEAARTLRYNNLERVRKELKAEYIVTAHHADDLCEDILMRLCRGCGWPGLGGMQEKDTTRHILRPLLILPKTTLVSLLQSLSIPWCTDSSNFDQHYTRNRFRSTITPLFFKENPSFYNAIQTTHKLAQIDANFWDTYLADILNSYPWSYTRTQNKKSVFFSKTLITKTPQAARLRLYRLGLLLIHAPRSSATHLFTLDDTVNRGVGGKKIQFPGNVVAEFTQGSIRLTHSLRKI